MKDRITINSQVRFGKPCIKGTRIAVIDILELLAGGYAIEDIPEQFDGITKEDVLAALRFATSLVEEPTNVLNRNLAPAD